ncbi:anti-sigma factor [Stieleria varia]|uniref:Anti-sigma-K factor rskA n=1 Tax=Stieleria varia TaxID=2528005 RepID=A0A5C6AZ03_9BACT|nr:anti-sigma factor [Stieleria varia]TWU04707.1 Anti-sigma-K factor rskA [Stieleria varia]
MSDTLNPLNPDQLELIAGHVLDDLSDTEKQQIGEIWNDAVEAESDSLHLTAASIQMIFDNPPEMPDDLRRIILTDAQAFFAEQRVSPAEHGGETPAATLALPTPKVLRREWVAWLAAAAAILLAVGSWIGNRPSQVTDAVGLRRALVAEASDLIEVAWSPGKTPFPRPVQGDVVWSNEAQEGYMRFVDMPVNDPTQRQYQLWIIDPARDDEPIDGGVFDISSTGELVIPIHAKLKVLQPVAFAITIEKPGGVVVSTQDDLPLLAAVPSTEA